MSFRAKTICAVCSVTLGCLLTSIPVPVLAQLSMEPEATILPIIAHTTPRNGFCAMQAAQTTNPLAKIGTKAYSTPISTTEIQLSATTPTIGTVTIRVQEGAMGKLISVKAKSGYALIPVLNPVNHEQVDFTIMKLTVDDKGNESISHLGMVTASADEDATLEAAPDLTIKLLNITSESAKSSDAPLSSINSPKHP